MAYATKTSVPVDKSRAEIEKVLRQYGADQFSYGSDDARGMAVIRFRANNRLVQFVLRLPSKSDFKKTPTGLDRQALQVEREGFCPVQLHAGNLQSRGSGNRRDLG